MRKKGGIAMKIRRPVLRRILFAVVLCGLAAIILWPTSVPPLAEPEENLNTKTNPAPAQGFGSIENSDKAGMAKARLIGSFRRSEQNKYLEEFGNYKADGVFSNGFPDYFCGTYISVGGRLVALIKDSLGGDERERARQEICALAESEDLLFGYATYNYRELVAAMSAILSFSMQERSPTSARYEISGYEIDDYSNRVIVYMNVTDQPARRWFAKHVTDAPFVLLEDTSAQIKRSAPTEPT